MELMSNDTRVQKLIKKSTFKDCKYYGAKLVAITLENKIIKFDKLIYIGFAVLEVSKTLMYNYHYDVVKSHYNADVTLMYADTGKL
jgi:hypothetical protein